MKPLDKARNFGVLKNISRVYRNLDLVIHRNNLTWYLYTDCRSDLMQQFFLTKVDTLVRVHWDDILKNNDHYDFLFNAKKNNLRLVTCTDIKVLHNKKVCDAVLVSFE